MSSPDLPSNDLPAGTSVPKGLLWLLSVLLCGQGLAASGMGIASATVVNAVSIHMIAPPAGDPAVTGRIVVSGSPALHYVLVPPVANASNEPDGCTVRIQGSMPGKLSGAGSQTIDIATHAATSRTATCSAVIAYD